MTSTRRHTAASPSLIQHGAAIVVKYLTPLSAANTSFACPHKLAGKLATGL